MSQTLRNQLKKQEKKILSKLLDAGTLGESHDRIVELTQEAIRNRMLFLQTPTRKFPKETLFKEVVYVLSDMKSFDPILAIAEGCMREYQFNWFQDASNQLEKVFQFGEDAAERLEKKHLEITGVLAGLYNAASVGSVCGADEYQGNLDFCKRVISTFIQEQDGEENKKLAANDVFLSLGTCYSQRANRNDLPGLKLLDELYKEPSFSLEDYKTRQFFLNYAMRDAARYGHIDVVKYLLAQGADTNHSEGEALYFAACEGRLDIVELLYPLTSHEKKDSMPLLGAVYGGHKGVIDYLFPMRNIKMIYASKDSFSFGKEAKAIISMHEAEVLREQAKAKDVPQRANKSL